MSWPDLAEGDRVTLLKLDGIGGEVKRVRRDGRVAVLADCATQVVVWDREDLGPPRTTQGTRQEDS
jgi:hypothetical protein